MIPFGTAIEKHPHERGEDRLLYTFLVTFLETPPRAWGRPKRPRKRLITSGNTPTSVGKTITLGRQVQNIWKHPHERGEDPTRALAPHASRETPPRAWGRQRPFRSITTWNRKHPHERGEDVHFRLRWYQLPGNTPTSVGKTRYCFCWYN